MSRTNWIFDYASRSQFSTSSPEPLAEVRQRYEQSPKAQLRQKIYDTSEKGRDRYQRYAQKRGSRAEYMRQRRLEKKLQKPIDN